MKINILGNTCNNAYAIVKYLRQLGVDAHLFYNKTLDIQTLPQSEDPELLKNFPDWLHPYSEEDTGPHPFRSANKEFLEKISDCDLIQAEDVGIIWAMQSGKPYVWIPYGWDLNFYSFFSYWKKYYQNDFPEYFLTPVIYRQAIANASAVIWGLFDQNLRHGFQIINDLVEKQRFVHNNTLLIDTARFVPQEGHTAQELLNELGIDNSVEGLTIFFPSRLMFSKDTYYSKRSDVLLYAAGKLKQEGIPFTLIIVEKGNPDELLAKEIIKDLNIEDRTIWIPKMQRHQLIKWYSTADITVDEFSSGAVGSLALEAIACNGTMMTYFKNEHEDPISWPTNIAFGTNPPLINVYSVDDTFNALKYYSAHRDELRRIAKSGRDWVESTISGEATARGFIELYKRILNGDLAPAGIRLHSLTPESEKNRISEYINAVEQLLAQGKKDEAYEAVINYLDKAPDNQYLIILFIRIMIKQGKALHAIEGLKQAIELMPNERLLRDSLYEIYVNLYRYFDAAGDLQNSIYFCEAAIGVLNSEVQRKRKENNATAEAGDLSRKINTNDYLTLADLYLKAGKYHELLKFIETIEITFPGSILGKTITGKFRTGLSQFRNDKIKTRTFASIGELEKHLGFTIKGRILEEDIDVMDHECDLFGRKRHDAEVLTTVAANVKGKCFDIGTSFGA
ncbi:MAG: glycosyltransferase, partial [Syntrophothermus sp.]